MAPILESPNIQNQLPIVYVVTGTIVAIVLAAALAIVIIRTRRRKATSPVDPGLPKHSQIQCPPVARARDNVTTKTDTSSPQPIRIKARGLLESSAEEYLSSAGNRLSRKQLRTCLKDKRSLREEFCEIPLNHSGKLDILGCSNKNRYKSIWPNPQSRVILKEENNCPASSYINANYIRGLNDERAFIAAQGPLPNTVNDFWRMAWEERSPCIVMMTKLREKQKIKCEAYVPNTEETYGSIRVTVRSVVTKQGYYVRDLLLQRINAKDYQSNQSSSQKESLNPGGQSEDPTPLLAKGDPLTTTTTTTEDSNVAKSRGVIFSTHSQESTSSPCSVSPDTNHRLEKAAGSGFQYAQSGFTRASTPPSNAPGAAAPLHHSSPCPPTVAPHQEEAAAEGPLTWQVKHYWFTAWPDHKAPAPTARHMIELVKDVQAEVQRRKQLSNGTKVGATVVHCSAGIGRTGCFVGTALCMKQLEEENAVDILGAVCKMRLDRGGMIQTLEQYEFLHHAMYLFEKTLPETPGSAPFAYNPKKSSSDSTSSHKSGSNEGCSSKKNSRQRGTDSSTSSNNTLF